MIFEPRAVEPSHFKLWLRQALVLAGRRFHFHAAGLVALIALGSLMPSPEFEKLAGLYSLDAIARRLTLAVMVLLVYAWSIAAAIDADGGSWKDSYKQFLGSTALITRTIGMFVSVLLILPMVLLMETPRISNGDPLVELYLHIGQQLGFVAMLYCWLSVLDNAIHTGDFLVVPLVSRMKLDYEARTDLIDLAMDRNPWLSFRLLTLIGTVLFTLLVGAFWKTIGQGMYWPIGVPFYLAPFLFGPFCFAAYRDIFEHREETAPEVPKMSTAPLPAH